MIKGNIEIAIRMLRKLSIRLRETERRLEGLQADGRSAAPARQAAAAKPKSAGSAGTGTRLEVDGDGASFAVLGSETLIGRFDPVTEQMPDVDLTQVDLKRSVSRRHARLVRTAEGFILTEEIGALNGTFVNTTKLVTGRAHPVQDGDKVSIGMVKLVFRA
jgi:pSer/pThr/pTyr-binding forkhead associated (FHA) protein